MTITILNNTIRNCGTAISAPSDMQGLYIGNNSIIDCGNGIVFRDRTITDNDLKNLIEKIDALALINEEEILLANQAKRLIEIEISLPPQRREVEATLRSICESVAASSIFAAIQLWASTLPM